MLGSCCSVSAPVALTASGWDFECAPLRITVDDQEQLVRVFQCNPDPGSEIQRGFLLQPGFDFFSNGAQFTSFKVTSKSYAHQTNQCDFPMPLFSLEKTLILFQLFGGFKLEQWSTMVNTGQHWSIMVNWWLPNV